MRNYTREQGNKTWVSGGQETLPIARDYAYDNILIELKADITISGGNTSGTLKDLAPAQLLKTVELRANGRDVIKSLDFEGLCRLTHIRYGTAPDNTLMANGDNQANTVCYVYGILPLAMWRAVQPFDTLFNAKPLTTLEMILTFGTAADIYSTAGNRTTAINSAYVYVASREAVGLDPAAILPVNKEGTIEDTPASTSSDYKIPLNYAKDLSYRTLVFRTKADDVVVNTIINNIKIQSGGVIFYNVNDTRTRARNKSIYSLEAMPTGYYAVDFCEDGRLGDALDTSGLSSLEAIIDLTHVGTTDKIKIYTTEIIRPTVQK